MLMVMVRPCGKSSPPRMRIGFVAQPLGVGLVDLLLPAGQGAGPLLAARATASCICLLSASICFWMSAAFVGVNRRVERTVPSTP